MRRHGKPAALVLVLSILAAAPAVSEIGVWEPVGPRSGFVDTLAVDPTDRDRLYALQGGALVRSTDGGVTWLPGLTLPFGEILSVAVAPSEPDILYAGTRAGSVFRSLDAGVTWAITAPIPESAPFLVSTLAVDPRDADHVLAGSGAQGDEFVARSTDGGSTWSLVAPGGELFVRDVVFDRGESSTVYAASSVALYRSLDGGATWAEVGEPSVLAHDLEAHPTEPGILFAAAGAVMKSTDGGETWRRLGGADGPGFAGELAVDPADPERIFASGRWGLWRTDDGGASWTLQPSLLTSSPTRTNLFGIELSSHPPGTLFVLTATGILESPDGGASWRLRTPRGPDLLVHDLLAPGKGPQRLFAATAEGLFVTEDGGESWSFVPGAGAVRVWSLAANGSPTPRLFVATDSALLATEDGGETFEDVTLQGIGPHLLAVDRVRPDTLYFWTGDLGMLFRSRDGGESWTQVTEAENNCFSALVPHATRADALFGTASCCMISHGDPCGGTWVSFDGWSTRETLRERGGADLAFRPPQTLFVTENGFQAGVLRSTDLGGTWELVSEELALDRASQLLIDPTDPSVVLAVARLEQEEPAGLSLIVSEDGGDTWAFLGESLAEGVRVEDLEIDPRRPELVFAATPGGVFRLQRREASSPPEPPAGPWLESPEVPGFRVKVRITSQSGVQPPVRREPDCIPETLCVSGAVPGRSEVFVRIVGPKPNGFLWPTLVKFSTSTVEIWLEETSSGILRYYRLEGAEPGENALPGLFDRTGFSP